MTLRATDSATTAATAKTALVIGAGGGIGGEVARRLRDEGWRVRGLARDPAAAAQKARWLGPIDWIAGDAMRPEDVIRAATGVDVISTAPTRPPIGIGAAWHCRCWRARSRPRALRGHA